MVDVNYDAGAGRKSSVRVAVRSPHGVPSTAGCVSHGKSGLVVRGRTRFRSSFGSKTLGEGNQNSLNFLEWFHAAFRSAQGDYALRSGDDGYREQSC